MEQQGGPGALSRIDFVLFSPDVYEAWVTAAEELSHGPVPSQEGGEEEEGEGSDAKKHATQNAVREAKGEEGGRRSDSDGSEKGRGDLPSV
jgi:hypothetical protein